MKYPSSCVVLSVDPANTAMGIVQTRIVDGCVEVARHASTYDVWSGTWPSEFHAALTSFSPSENHYVVVYEAPAHGTHVAREGIARSVGEVLTAVKTLNGSNLKRDFVLRLPLGEWRRFIFGKLRLAREQWKELALQRCKDLSVQVADDNQAEAWLMCDCALHKYILPNLTTRSWKPKNVKNT